LVILFLSVPINAIEEKLRFKEPANLRALVEQARGENQLIHLIFKDLSPFAICVPEEKDNREHYTPVSERNTPGINLIGADEQKGGRQAQEKGVPKFHEVKVGVV
jgi:hypothetical protein